MLRAFVPPSLSVPSVVDPTPPHRKIALDFPGLDLQSTYAKKYGVSDVTIYAWRKPFGKLEAIDVKRLLSAMTSSCVRLQATLAGRFRRDRASLRISA